MGKVQIVLLSFYEVLCLVLALLGAPLVVLAARWDDETTTFTGGAPNNGPATIRGDLPEWCSWWGTIDERLPAGMYEATMVSILNKNGRYWCSVRWLWRNRMMGLTAFLFGKPLHPDDTPRGYTSVDLGPLRAGYGWKKYRATPQASWIDGPFIEMPSVSIRLRKNA